ncbi:MAG: hypothetical protein AB7K71_00465 [Polyangiaceae bacterium]
MLWFRMKTGAKVALLAVALTAFAACGSDDSGGDGGESDPVNIACYTPGKFACIYGGACHEFYTPSTQDATNESCRNVGGTVLEAGCPDSYTQCCIRLEGSNDKAEGICIEADDPDAAGWQDACGALTEPSLYCAR